MRNLIALALALVITGCSGSDSGEQTPPESDAALADSAPFADVTDRASGDTSAAVDLSAPGPFGVNISNATIDGRAVHLLAPKGAAPASGFPAVVFAHGFLLKTTDYDQLLSAVAAWGYVVLSVDFPGSLFSIDHRDVRTAIIAGRDALLAGKVTGAPKVDGTKIVAAGHSLGGKGALMAVLADAGFAGAFPIDPVDGNPSPLGMTPSEKTPKLAPTETPKIKVPVGYVGATQSRCVKPPAFPGAPAQACAPETLDAATLYATTPAPKYLWTMLDVGHMQFLDNPMCGTSCDACAAGKADVGVAKKAVASLLVAFMRFHLDGDAAAKSWLDGDAHKALVAKKALWDGTSSKPTCP